MRLKLGNGPIALDYDEFLSQRHLIDFELRYDYFSKHSIDRQEFRAYLESFFAQRFSLVALGYSFPSGVLLGVGNWDDIEFYLLVLFAEKIKGFTVEVQNPSKIHRLLLGKNSGFWPLFILAFFKVVLLFIRGMLRSLLSVGGPIKRNVFVSMWDGRGEFSEKYFGDLVNVAGVHSLVVFSGGKSVLLRGLGRAIAIETIVPIKSHVEMALQQLRMLLSIRNNHCEYSKLLKYLYLQELGAGMVYTNLLARELGNTLAVKAENSSVIIFPFENRTWEKMLCSSLEGSQFYSVGYNHAMITPRHLALTVLGERTPKRYLPNRIVSCGTCTFGKLVSSFSGKDVEVESGPALRISDEFLRAGKKRYVYLPMSSGLEEAKFLINLARQLSLKTGLNSLIRPHPSMPLASILDKSCAEGIMFSNGVGILEELEGALGCVFVSSSVGAEAAYRGVPSVCLTTGDLFGVSPVQGCSEVQTLSSFQELVSWLETVAAGDTTTEVSSLTSSLYTSRLHFSEGALRKLFNLQLGLEV